MTDEEKQAFADYVRAVMDELHLKDWDANVHFVAPSLNQSHPDALDKDTRNAQVETTRWRKQASFEFDPDLLPETSPDEIRQTVVHEIIHCHFSEMWHWARITLLDHGDVTQTFYDMFIAGIEQGMEMGVDGVADAVAPHMPVFQWPKPKAKSRATQ